MRILHIASFVGNIGDNASHIGFLNIIRACGIANPKITRLEIRKFYNSYEAEDKLKFDYRFAEIADQYDLVVIGGGGFLDFWVENSTTGTTIDISQDVLDKISTPIFITSVGCVPHKPVPDGNIERFQRFLDDFLARKNCALALRSDGSKDVIQELFGDQYNDSISHILDNAFFYENSTDFLLTERDYMVINIAEDQLFMQNRIIGKIEVSEFYQGLIHFINNVLTTTDLQIVFVSHIYKDLNVYLKLINSFDDFVVRTRFIIAPLIQYDEGCDKVFSIYKSSSAIVGMRYHSNVCSLAMNKNITGLVALDRVKYLYDGIGMNHSYVSIDKDFVADLTHKFSKQINNSNPLTSTENIRKNKLDTLDVYKSVFRKLKI
ncbi:polysaccharide pyruvyl transferase family protein [Roseivirga echinicomitans]